MCSLQGYLIFVNYPGNGRIGKLWRHSLKYIRELIENMQNLIASRHAL